MEYKIIRARRRTAAIYVTRDAAVEVRAPHSMPKEIIDRFVASRERWIGQHVEIRRHALAQRASFTLGYASRVRFCGESVEITAHESKRGFAGGRFYAPAGLNPEEIKRAVKQGYIDSAKAFLPEKTEAIARRMGVCPSAVKVSGAKSQWGSCSGKNSISYSWRLMLADEDVIDYVVTHELAHIKEHNHSARFWAVVEQYIPDWRQRVRRLSELQGQLLLENWD